MTSQAIIYISKGLVANFSRCYFGAVLPEQMEIIIYDNRVDYFNHKNDFSDSELFLYAITT